MTVPTLALDVYGTLIDPLNVTELLRDTVADQAPAMAELWRTKQLEYSFRHAAMQRYRSFSELTAAALDYTLEFYKTQLGDAQKNKLLKSYDHLTAYAEVAPALKSLSEKNIALYAFSNGTQASVETVLKNANLYQYIRSVVSVEAVRTYKPSPIVYQHFNHITSSEPVQTCLVSSNPFDIIGASECGWQSVWIKRSGVAVFDPWGIEPSITIASLSELEQALKEV